MKEATVEIIEEDTLREAIKECVRRGMRPASYEEVWKLRDGGVIPDQWYDTGTLIGNGLIRAVTRGDLNNIEVLYGQGFRLLGVGSGGSGGFALDEYDLVNDGGRLVGVRDEE